MIFSRLRNFFLLKSVSNLELGGGESPKPGYVSLDIKKFNWWTVVWNLEDGLPTKKKFSFFKKYAIQLESVTNIFADNCLEHIHNLIPLMNDCYDVIAPKGKFLIIVPLASTTGDWKDPTHVRHFVPESFDYFDIDWNYGRQPNYGIKKWKVLEKEVFVPDKKSPQYKYLRVVLERPYHTYASIW